MVSVYLFALFELASLSCSRFFFPFHSLRAISKLSLVSQDRRIVFEGTTLVAMARDDAGN